MLIFPRPVLPFEFYRDPDKFMPTMKDSDHRVDAASRDAGRPAQFEATVTKVLRRPCLAFVIEVEAVEFANVQPGQRLSTGVGWFLISGTRFGDTSVRFRGFGRPKLAVGDRIVVRTEASQPADKPART
jgi:hypothetical protein